MKTICIIPARGGSKRIPNKNLQKIGELSLVEWTIATALACNMDGEPIFSRVILSSDSSEILKLGAKYHFIELHKRSAKAASDEATDLDVISEVLFWLPADLVVYLRPTTPFRTVSAVCGAVKRMKDVEDISGLRSVHEMSETAFKSCVMNTGNILQPAIGVAPKNMDSINLPARFYPLTYHPNGVVDVIRTSTLEGGGLFGHKVLGWLTKPTIEIDTPHDLLMARVWHAYQLQPQEFFKPY